MKRRIITTLGVLSGALLGLAGCHGPSGGLMRYTGATQTYESTEAAQKTVHVIDTRTGEIVFEQDIPVGKWLTMDFIAGGGDDPVNTPDLMRYQIWEIGSKYGKLRNAQTVPNAISRRVDVFVRQGPVYQDPPPNERLRTDQVAERPDWWTPEGGALPENDKHIYDN